MSGSEIRSFEIKQLPARLSAVVRNRRVFFCCMAILSIVKLALSAIAPASYDLRDIVTLVASNRLIGPWIVLYPLLYSPLNATLNQLESWYATTPPAMGLNMQLISLLFRIPIFVFDLAIAGVLYYTVRRMGSPSQARLASLIWFANPYSFLSTELLGVPDVLATFFVVVAISLLISRRPIWSGIFLALGICTKFYPILLIPPLLIYACSAGVSRRNRLTIVGSSLVGLFCYLSWVLPFGTEYLTQYSPVTQPIPMFLGSYVTNSYGFVFVLILFYGLLGLFARKIDDPFGTLLSTFLVFYVVSSPYPQYLVWAMPLMAIDVGLHRQRGALFIAFCSLAFIQWFLVSPALITPSGYSLLMIPFTGDNLPWYSVAIGHLLDTPVVGNLLLPIVSSSLVGIIVFYAVDLSRNWFRISSRDAMK